MEDTLQMVGLGETFPVSLMCLAAVVVFEGVDYQEVCRSALLVEEALSRRLK